MSVCEQIEIKRWEGGGERGRGRKGREKEKIIVYIVWNSHVSISVCVRLQMCVGGCGGVELWCAPNHI